MKTESYYDSSKTEPITYVIVSGGFDPFHVGHLSYLEAAKRLGDVLVVGCNSDEWLTRKKGKPFMNRESRKRIVGALRCVDWIMDFDDTDNSAADLIRKVMILGANRKTNRYIFANGGDRTARNIPEMDQTYPCEVEWVFGVGGEDKAESSSRLLAEWNFSKK